jgi:hypothetical protein
MEWHKIFDPNSKELDRLAERGLYLWRQHIAELLRCQRDSTYHQLLAAATCHPRFLRGKPGMRTVPRGDRQSL